MFKNYFTHFTSIHFQKHFMGKAETYKVFVNNTLSFKMDSEIY